MAGGAKKLEEPLVGARQSKEASWRWTVTGCIGICFWASSFATARILSSTVGTFLAMGVAFTVGGIGANFVMLAMGRFSTQLQNPVSYWLMCGVPFALYPFFLYLGFSQATGNDEIVLLTVINYLWPQIMSLLGITFLGQQWKWPLAPAMIGAVCSIVAMNFKPGMTAGDLLESFVRIWPAAVSCVLAAMCWASYSVAAKYFSHQGFPSAVPLMTIFGGLACLAGKVITGEASPVPLEEALMDPNFCFALAYMILVPVIFCRFTWDAACRHGHLPVLTAFAYLNPFLATMINLVVLSVPPSLMAIAGSLGLVCCSVVASVSVKERT